MSYYIGWVSVDGAGSQNHCFVTLAEAKAEADRFQADTDSHDYDGIINPFGYRYWVARCGAETVYRTTPSVRPGTKKETA